MSDGPRRVRLRAGGAQALTHTLRPEIDVAGLHEGVAETLAAVARIAAAGRPSGPGGLTTATRSTPATCAGTTPMTRLEG